MKTKINTQEVLLMTNTSFSKRQLCETKPQNSKERISCAHRLELACCNGMLYEMLPEIMPVTNSKQKLYLWTTEIKKFYLRILLGTQPVYITRELSIAPHIFLPKCSMN